jgi:shikimate dehydrogenase
VPHKQAVVPFLDALTPEAQAIGAVNTIIIKEEQLVGTNTDAWGFWRDLEDLGITDALSTEENALVLGAGGSARAIAYALATHGISTHILARRLSQAQQLITALKPHLSHPHRLQAHSWTDLPAWASAARLIVNCTPVGMAPHINHSPWPHTLPLHPGQMVYDLVYNPPLTSLMAQAQNAGALAWNGLGMLVYQGARSWELWTGRAAPIAAMRAAIT